MSSNNDNHADPDTSNYFIFPCCVNDNDIHAAMDSENHLAAKNDESFASQFGEGKSDSLLGGDPGGNPERKGVVDLVSKGDEEVADLECGTVDVDGVSHGDASLWVAARRLLTNLDFWSLGEAISVEPVKVLCKPPMDPSKTENKNGGRNPSIAESRIESENLNLKPSGKKPPRPPKPSRLLETCGDSSKDRVIKATLRRAKLEKLASLKKKQMHKSKTSTSSMWALVCTLCFCVVMVIQGTGLFSQGNNSAQITPAEPVHTETFHVHKYNNLAANSESLHAIIQDQPSSMHHFGPALDKDRHVQSDLRS